MQIGPQLTSTRRNICYGCQHFNRVLAKSSRQQPLYNNYCQHPQALQEIPTRQKNPEAGRWFSRNGRALTPRWCPVLVEKILSEYAEKLEEFGKVATGEKNDDQI